MHYCDVLKFVWQVQKVNSSPKPTTHLHPPPLSVHYKSLVIGLLLCRQVLVSGGAPAGIRLTSS